MYMKMLSAKWWPFCLDDVELVDCDYNILKHVKLRNVISTFMDKHSSCHETSSNGNIFRVTGLCAGNSPVTGEFHVQQASNAENVSIWREDLHLDQ